MTTDQKDTLRASILGLGGEDFSARPDGIRYAIYLDPAGYRVYASTMFGHGVPMPAYDGVHLRVCDIQPGAVAASVVEAVMSRFEVILGACDELDDSDSAAGEDDWSISASYALSRIEQDIRADVVRVSDPGDWFAGVTDRIEAMYRVGVEPESIVDELGTEGDGWERVDHRAAVEWVQGYVASRGIKRDPPQPCVKCGANLPESWDVFCAACGGPER